MDSVPIYVPGQALPYCLNEVFAPGLLNPSRRRLARFLIWFALALWGALVALGTHASVATFLVSLVVSVPVSWLILRAIDFARRKLDPMPARLCDSPDGIALLAEGQALHDQRKRVMDGSKGPHPLLEAFYAPQPGDALVGGDVLDRKQEVVSRYWQYHLSLERDLRDRQDRFLKGETVVIVGHLSESSSR